MHHNKWFLDCYTVGTWCLWGCHWSMRDDPQLVDVTDSVNGWSTVYPKKYIHGFVVLCFVVVMQSFIMNSYEVSIHIHQGCFAGTGAIVRLPQCQWSKPDGYGKISQCITTTKHCKAKTVCIFLGIYCNHGFDILQGLWMLRCEFELLTRILIVFQRPPTVPYTAVSACNLPTFRAVQWDCKRVC